MTNEHFIVWMRTASLSQFRKLWGVIDVDLPGGASPPSRSSGALRDD